MSLAPVAPFTFLDSRISTLQPFNALTISTDRDSDRQMKFAIFGFICLLSIAATCALYGWLESSVNMIEGFGQLFAPGATTVLFSPFLLLFIVLSLGVFIATPLLAVAVTAVFGGY